MSTRSNIIRENTNGSFDMIYCHWDGYPSHNGRILFENYQDPTKIQKLLNLGGLSILGPEIGHKHAFDRFSGGKYTPYQVKLKDGTKVDGCTAFGRDRGETGMTMIHFADADALAEYLEEAWTEWVYIFRMVDGKWYYTNNASPTWFKCCGPQREGLELLTPEAYEE